MSPLSIKISKSSALHVGAKYKSFTDLECALKIFQQDNYVQLYRPSSRKLGTGSKYIGIIPVFMEGQILVPFPTVNAQTQGKITYNIP